MKHPTRARVLLRIGLITAPPEGNNNMGKITAYLKAIVALAGSALLVWNEYSPGFVGLLPGSWSHGISVFVGLLTFVATFAVPNLTNDPAVAAAQSVVLRSGRHERPE